MHAIRNLASHYNTVNAKRMKSVAESYQNFNQHRDKRNGRFDLGARQLSRIRLQPCGATMGSVGTCSTVL